MKPTQLTVIAGLLAALTLLAFPAIAGVDTSRIRVTRVSGNTWVVKRQDVKPLMNERGRAAIVKEVRLRKHAPQGRQWGYKVRRVQPNSAFKRLGIQAGDVLTHVNGVALTSDGQALRAYNKARKAETIRVVIQRRDKRRTLYYKVK